MKLKGLFCLLMMVIISFLPVFAVSTANDIEILSPDIPPSTPGEGIFTENLGQIENDEIRFTGSSSLGAIGFLDGSIMIKNEGGTIGFIFQDGNDVIPQGRDPLPWKNNYFYGSDPDDWRTNVPNFREIVYEDLWNGIDLVYRSKDGALKYDLVLHPYSDPSQIRIEVQGHNEIEVLNGVDLKITSTRNKEFELLDTGLDVFYEEDVSEKIASKVVLDKNVYGYFLNEYDPSRTVVIDPLVYSTYIGGISWEESWELDVDDEGCAYITRNTDSLDFPTTAGSYSPDFNGGEWDIYVSKLSADGASLEYSTYIGGSGYEIGVCISVDDEGYAYIGGSTISTDFPTTPGAYNTALDGESNGGFVLKLGPDGDSLEYSTLIWGQNDDAIHRIEIDDSGNAYVVGMTESWDLPVTSGAFDEVFNGGVVDTFLARFNPAGSNLEYCTYIGGSGREEPFGLAVDDKGCMFVFGETTSRDLPTTEGAFNTKHAGFGWDLFLLKLNYSGTSLDYFTYIGGSGNEQAQDLVVDDGFAYITGATYSSNYPTVQGSFERSHSGNRDAYVTKINVSGDRLIFSSFLGGDYDDVGMGMDIDSEGYIYLTGTSGSLNFPTTYFVISHTISGPGVDSFVTKMAPDGGSLRYSTYLGGEGAEIGTDIFCDDNSLAYIVGYTDSRDFPMTHWAFDTNYSGGQHDVFISKLNLSTRPTAPRWLKTVFGDSYIELSWTEPEHFGGPAPIAYNVYRGSTPLGLKFYMTSETRMINDTGLINGEEYYYMVSTYNDMGEGGFSGKVSDTPGTTPDVPTDLKAVPGNKNVTLTWKEPEDDGGWIVYSYLLYRGTDPDNLTFLNNRDFSEEYLDRQVENGVTYYYRIKALNTLGKSPITEMVSARPANSPSMPQNMEIDHGNGWVNLSWTLPHTDGGIGIWGYDLYRGTGPNEMELFAELDNDVFAYRDTDVVNGVTYYYEVYGHNELGLGRPSDQVSATPATRPGAVRNMVTTMDDHVIFLSWDEPEQNGGYNITRYKIFRGYEADSLFYHAETTVDLNFTDIELRNGKTYYYQIIATNKLGDGPAGEIISEMPGAIPGTPYGFDVRVVSGKEVYMNWRPPVVDGGFDVTEYRIFKGPAPDDMEYYTTVNSSLSFTDSNVTKELIYYYAISAVNEIGEGERSNGRGIRVTDEGGGGSTTVTKILKLWWLFVIIGIIISALITAISYLFVRNKEIWLRDGKPQFNEIYKFFREKGKKTEDKKEEKDQSLR